MTKTCQTCGRALAPAADNAGRSETFTVPAALVPALRDALAIGRNTGMMCDEPDVQSGLEALRKEAEARIPEVATIFDPGLWAAIAGRAAGGLPLEVEVLNKGNGWSPVWHVAVQDPGGTRWPRRTRPGAPALSESVDNEQQARRLAQDLEALLARLAPLG